MDTIVLRVLGLVLVFGFQPLLVGAISLTTSIAFWVSLAFAGLGIVGTLFFTYIPDDVKDPLLLASTAAAWIAVLCIDRYVDLNTYAAYNVFGLSSVFVAVSLVITQRLQALPIYILILVTSLILITNSLIGASYVTVFVCIFFFGALVYALAYLIENDIRDRRAFIVAFWTTVFVLQQSFQYHVQNNWMYFSLALIVAWAGIESFLNAVRRGGESTGNWILLGHLFTGFIEIVLLALYWGRVGDLDMIGAFSVMFMALFFVFSFMRNERTLLHLCGAIVVMSTVGWIGVDSLGLSIVFPILNAALVLWAEIQKLGTESWLTSTAAVAFSVMAGAVRPQGVGILAATYAVGASTFTVLGLLEAIRAKNGRTNTLLSIGLYGGAITYALSFLGSLTVQATVVLLILGVYGVLLLVYLVWSNRTLRRVTP